MLAVSALQSAWGLLLVPQEAAPGEQERQLFALLRESAVAPVEEVQQAPAPIVFAAHSLGCIAVAHWCQANPEALGKIKGALMVAPVDLDGKETPLTNK